MNAQKFLSFSGVALLALLVVAPAARAQVYNFNFTGGVMTATGTITVDPLTHLATAGSINVFHVPIENTALFLDSRSKCDILSGCPIHNLVLRKDIPSPRCERRGKALRA